MAKCSASARTFFIALTVSWMTVVVAGSVGMIRYQMTAASDVHASPAQWPKSAVVPRERERATLVMSLHPQCPCSRASLNELAILLSRAGDRVAARILVVRPAGAPADWVHSNLVERAAALPGVTVVVDENGDGCRTFGATTSGQVALYDRDGKLLFSGGITDGRGHEGENVGLQSALQQLRGTKRDGGGAVRAPVYGCPLHARESGCAVRKGT